MEFLSVGLPEDIQRELFLGDIGKALLLIEKKLSLKLPNLLKERLLYEKERLNRLILNYPYSTNEAKKIAEKTIKGFSPLEFEKLLNSGDLDYIIVNGKMYFEKRFAFNIGFKYDEYKKRIKTDEKVLKRRELFHNRLDEIINGDNQKNYKVRAKITVKPDYENIQGEIIKAWLPIPYENFQISDVKILKTSHEKYTILNSQQRTIYFEDEVKNKSSFYVEFEYKISEWTNNIDINVKTTTRMLKKGKIKMYKKGIKN